MNNKMSKGSGNAADILQTSKRDKYSHTALLTALVKREDISKLL